MPNRHLAVGHRRSLAFLNSIPFRLAIAGAVVALAVVILRPGIDWPRVALSLSQLNWGLLGLAALCMTLPIMVRAARWQILLGRASPNDYADFLRATAIGFFTAAFLPGSGEVSRIAVMKRRSGLPLGFIGGTVLLEKFLDTTLLVGSLALVLLVSHAAAGLAPVLAAASSAAIALVALSVVALAAPNLAERFQGRLERLSRSSRLAARTIGLLNGVLAGLKVLQAGGLRRAVLTLLASVLVLVTGLIPYSLMLAAFNLDLPPFAPMLLVTALNIGLTIPSAPGALGTYQAVAAGALALMSVEVGIGLAFGAVLHLVIFIPLIIMGLIATFSESIPLRRLGDLGRSDVTVQEPAVGAGFPRPEGTRGGDAPRPGNPALTPESEQTKAGGESDQGGG